MRLALKTASLMATASVASYFPDGGMAFGSLSPGGGVGNSGKFASSGLDNVLARSSEFSGAVPCGSPSSSAELSIDTPCAPLRAGSLPSGVSHERSTSDSAAATAPLLLAAVNGATGEVVSGDPVVTDAGHEVWDTNRSETRSTGLNDYDNKIDGRSELRGARLHHQHRRNRRATVAPDGAVALEAGDPQAGESRAADLASPPVQTAPTVLLTPPVHKKPAADDEEAVSLVSPHGVSGLHLVGAALGAMAGELWATCVRCTFHFADFPQSAGGNSSTTLGNSLSAGARRFGRLLKNAFSSLTGTALLCLGTYSLFKVAETIELIVVDTADGALRRHSRSASAHLANGVAVGLLLAQWQPSLACLASGAACGATCDSGADSSAAAAPLAAAAFAAVGRGSFAPLYFALGCQMELRTSALVSLRGKARGARALSLCVLLWALSALVGDEMLAAGVLRAAADRSAGAGAAAASFLGGGVVAHALAVALLALFFGLLLPAMRQHGDLDADGRAGALHGRVSHELAQGALVLAGWAAVVRGGEAWSLATELVARAVEPVVPDGGAAGNVAGAGAAISGPVEVVAGAAAADVASESIAAMVLRIMGPASLGLLVYQTSVIGRVLDERKALHVLRRGVSELRYAGEQPWWDGTVERSSTSAAGGKGEW